jgi:hypothetical protein
MCLVSIKNIVPPEDDAISAEKCWGVCKKLEYWILVRVYELVVYTYNSQISRLTEFLRRIFEF